MSHDIYNWLKTILEIRAGEMHVDFWGLSEK